MTADEDDEAVPGVLAQLLGRESREGRLGIEAGDGQQEPHHDLAEPRAALQAMTATPRGCRNRVRWPSGSARLIASGFRLGWMLRVLPGCALPPLLEPIRLLGVVAGLLALVGGAVALVGGPVAVALVGSPVAVALVGGPLAHISGPLTGIGKMVAVISGTVAIIREVVPLVSVPLTHSEIVLGPVQGRLASGQPCLGRLKVSLGLPGPRLGRLDRSVIQRPGRDPLPLAILDHLQRDLGQLP